MVRTESPVCALDRAAYAYQNTHRSYGKGKGDEEEERLDLLCVCVAQKMYELEDGARKKCENSANNNKIGKFMDNDAIMWVK